MRPATHRKLVIESLEKRQLLAVSPLANALAITLTADGCATQSGKIVHPGDTIAYRFTAPATGTMVLRESPTGSSLFPTAVTMFDAGQRQLASNVGNLTACVQVPVTRGSVYYALAAANQSTVGAFQLQICMDDVGNTPAKATTFAIVGNSSSAVALIGSATQTGKINYVGDVDVFKFTAVVPGGVAGALGTMTIRLGAQSSSLRSVLDVYDAGYLSNPTKAPLAENSATAAGAAYSQVKILVASGNVYYLKASGALNTLGAYSIQVSTARADDPLPHSFAAADTAWRSSPFMVPADPANATVGPVKTMSGLIAYPGDADYIRFVAPVTGSMTVQQVADATQASTLDSYLYIYDAKQKLVVSNDNSGATSNPLDSRVQFQVQAGTSYYIKATGFGSSTGAYRLLISTKCTTTDDFPQLPPFSDANPATTVAIDPNTGAGKQAGSIDYLGDVDWFTFSPGVAGTMTIQETVMSGNFAPQVSVYSVNASGTPTTLLSSTVPGAIASFSVTVGQTYYVKAAASSQTAGQYVLQAYCASWAGIQDPDLAALVKQLFTRDGTLTREDMIQILNFTVSSGTLSAMDFSDLKKIVGQDATFFKMADYVRVLSSDIILGSPANTYYTGGANLTYYTAPTLLGNLHAGSSKLQMTRLIGKWFLGNDLPNPAMMGQDLNGNVIAAVAPVYAPVSGTLYGSVDGTPTPVLDDTQQGALGDCYFLACMAGVAKVSPTAIKNMFLVNSDGTWTIRFYHNGVREYVTVNNQLPVTPKDFGTPWTDGGALFNGAWTIKNPASAANVLWLSLLEKAYAQWNEVGREDHGAGYDGVNSYWAVEGGWSKPVYDQTLGANDKAVEYDNSLIGVGIPTTASVLINALNSGSTATLGTIVQGNLAPAWTDDNLLYTQHMYTVVSYDPSTQTFQLHNPWGLAPAEQGGPATQPPPMTWDELNADCDYLCIANPNNTVAFTASASTSTASLGTTAAVRHKTVFYATATSAAVNPNAAAAAAWLGLNGSHGPSQNDQQRTAAHDLALLAYLA
jgi:hypothetical protein